MTAPIGRIWINGKCISGYIIYGPMQTDIIKFACEKANEGCVWLFPSKKEKEEKEEA
mgnify:CR=1 FL=1